MEIIKCDGITELRLRPDDDDVDYWIYPEHVVEKTVELLTKSGIFFDLVTGDSEHFSMIPLASSAFDSDELKQEDAVAIQCCVDSADLDEAVRYVNEHNDVDKITIMKRSELPEYSDTVVEPAQDKELKALLELSSSGDGYFLTECSTDSEELSDVKVVMDSFMKTLLDMTDGNRWRAMMAFEEKASFGKLLRLYSKSVQEFILDHTSKRHAEALRKEMRDAKE